MSPVDLLVFNHRQSGLTAASLNIRSCRERGNGRRTARYSVSGTALNAGFLALQSQAAVALVNKAKQFGFQAPFTNDPLGWRKAKKTYAESDEPKPDEDKRT